MLGHVTATNGGRMEIELRRRIPNATGVVSITAYPAIVPGTEGFPDEPVLAIEIVGKVEGSETAATREVFAVSLGMADGAVQALDIARHETIQLGEELS